MPRSLLPFSAAGVLLIALLVAPAARGDDPRSERFGLGVTAGAALDRGGFELGAALRHAFTPRLMGGITAGWSAWFDVLSATFAPGTFNVYVSLSWKWVGTERVAVRSVVHLGSSVLLFEPVGARRGSIGVFGGLGLLGLSIRIGEGWSLELMPDVTLSIPSFTGVPLVYRQYRLMMSLVRWL